LRSGLIYSILTLFFTGIYALLIFYFGKAFQMLTGWNSFFATIGLVLLAILIFDPLRRYVQSAVDRIFFRGSYYYEKTINDLSAENLKLYRDLLRSEKLAALGTMSAGLAHEIKNPLASIKGLTQILKENLDDQEFIDKYTDIVPRQLDRINAIIETLLRIGRPVRYAVAEVDLCRLLGDIIKLAEAQLREKRIKVKMNVPSEMTAAGDPEQLTQALINLVVNAIDSMPNGGELKVSASRAPDGRVLAEISDTGCGIRDDDLARIFDPFFTTKEKGAGLGLSVTYRIIKEHGGEIEALSREGEGTKFKIWLCTKQKG
jgi:signal transduction histidine kinase